MRLTRDLTVPAGAGTNGEAGREAASRIDAESQNDQEDRFQQPARSSDMADDFYIRLPLRPDMCGDDVRYVQELLNTQGFDVPVTGVFDAQTVAAAKEHRIRSYLDRYDDGGSYGFPTDTDTLERMFRGDRQAYDKAQRANESWDFPSREAYEEYLRATPSPLPDFLHAYDVFALQEGIPSERLPEPMKGTNGMFLGELTETPPPSSEPYCAIPMSDSGGGSAITRLALYDEIRKQLPAEIGDERAAEATLRAMQDGIKTPGQMQDVVVANDRIFVVGNVPGFRGVVDLSQPPLPAAEIGAQFASLEQNSQNERQSVERRSHSLG